MGDTSWGGVRSAAVASSDVTVRNVVAGEARTPQDSATVATLQVGTPEGGFRDWEGRRGGLGILPLGEQEGLGVPGCPKPAEGHSALAWGASFR